MNILKVLAVMVICLATANVVLFAMGKLSTLLFWIIIIVCAVIAFWVVPRVSRLKEESNQKNE